MASEGQVEVADAVSASAPERCLFRLLPYEIVCQVAKHLGPRRHPSVHPHPKAQTIDVSAIVVPAERAIQDVLSFAYTSRLCYASALPVLYYAMILQSTRQVRLLAQSLTMPYQIKPVDFDEYNLSRQPRHLFLPNDGLLVGGTDQLSDQYQWAPSIRTIFRYSNLLDSALLGSRADGAMLSEFLDEHVQARPRRVTILNLYSSPPFSMWSLRPLSRVTHLHLINLIPRTAILELLSGVSKHAEGPHPITHLRLSMLHSDTLHGFGDYIKWRRSFDQWDALPALERNRYGVQPPERPRVPVRMFEAQETLYTLAVQAGKMPHFCRLLLELVELAPLPVPEDLPLLYDDERSAASIDGSTDAGGAVTTTNHPAGAPASLDEAQMLAEEAERNRTAHRDLYWIDTRDGKEALQTLFDESRQQALAEQDSAGASSMEGGDSRSSQSGGARRPAVEVRIVAPRPGGWDRNECRAEFEAQVEACSYTQGLGHDRARARGETNGSGPDEDDGKGEEGNDGTCFSDPDLFALAERRPWLSYDGARRPDWASLGSTGGGGSQGTDRIGGRQREDWRDPKRTWWTGSLPRYDASSREVQAETDTPT